ncbi:MAG TPA: 4-hydroxy-3-methylbut-2-enyl diphosphate reductase, partial [Thermoanaerobaculia bacterium]|nr:4-hydroxy-3-methylbut-2-enyl diphosphate reductase [Thermoanaerobaculia bacterium]
MKVRRAAKYGFCAGVRVADRKVKKFAASGETDGHILGQLVHNEQVVEEMEAIGVDTVDALDEIRAGAVVFSAHGVAPSVHEDARGRGLRILDTTCPFVYDIHDEADVAAA